MTNRVFLSPNNFRVSKPGFDAYSDTNPDHLLFDAFGWKSQGCFMKGVIHSNTLQFYSSSWIGTAYQTEVFFGKTFSSAPKIFWGVLDPQTNGFMASYQGLTQFGTYVTGAAGFQDRVRFWAVTNGSPPMSTSFYFVYFVFQA
jgi:hypothetical protein